MQNKKKKNSKTASDSGPASDPKTERRPSCNKSAAMHLSCSGPTSKHAHVQVHRVLS